MSLPESKTAWPPAEQTKRYNHMSVASAWYGGDPDQLRALYGDVNAGTRAGAATKGGNWLARTFGWLWGRVDPSQPDEKLHVPVATDISVLSSELLFARTPRFVVQPTEFDEDGAPSEAQQAEIAKTQARLDVLLDSCGFDATLLASAETQSALGSVGLKVAWDKDDLSMPVITRVDADACVPEYRFGQLRAVTFWSVAKDGETWWYHLERHEQGRIYHGLYKGVRGNLGQQMSLADHPMTRDLAELVDEESSIETADDAWTAVSIPNMLPDPLDRLSNAGRSDYTPGVIQLFDAIDKTYTSMMRDIDDGKSRLLVADYMLESRGLGKGVEFDQDQHLFTRLKMSPSDKGDAPIEQVQFSIRVAEHIAAIDHLVKKAVQSAGFSPQSLGDYESGSAMTATEVEARERRSISTMSKKRRYWQAVERLLEGLLRVDAKVYDSGVVPLPVKIEWQPVATDSLKVLAETVELMKRAEASSLEVRVRTLHPDWDDDEVLEEVERIQSESSAVDPATFGLPLPPADEDDDESDGFESDDDGVSNADGNA